MRWLALFALTGCQFVHGALTSARSDAAGEADADASIDAVDAPPDTTGPNCYARWMSGNIAFSTPVLLSSLNSSGFDRDPFFEMNELTGYVSSARTGSTGGDIWRATRSSLSGAFSTPALASEFNSVGNETKLSISENQRIAVVGSDRTGGEGGIDVWMSTRASATNPWPAMTQTGLSSVNSSIEEHDPTLSTDGLHLYLAPHDGSDQDLAMASRTSTSQAFGSPARLTTLNSTSGDADPSPTPDELIIVFSSGRTLLGAANGNIWYSTRATKTAAWAFATAVPSPVINTDAAEGDPHLSTDGCRLYFGRDSAANDNWEIYVATMQ
ncbi:MAG TPA: hypothetical protein VMZ53_03210 [Kofleriaceae bacterium]|nr:hypothetical protein [Kofleriaceae bacterium]